MNLESFERKIADKMLVIPMFFIKGQGGYDSYLAKSIHGISENKAQNPDSRELCLYMPCSASEQDLSLAQNSPKRIKIKIKNLQGSKTKSRFNLKCLPQTKTFAEMSKGLSPREQTDLRLKFDLPEDDPKAEVVVPKTYTAWLPLKLEDHVLSEEFKYSDVVRYVTLGLYETFSSEFEKSKPKSKKRKNADKLALQQEEQKLIAFGEFLNSFDAFEIVKSSSTFVGIEREGYDKGVVYKPFEILLYKVNEPSYVREQIHKAIYGEKEQNKEKNSNDERSASNNGRSLQDRTL